MKKMYQEIKFKSREEWLNAGRKFGGSSASAIINANHWQGQIDVWGNYFNKKTSDQKTASQVYGTKVEDYLREIVKLNLAESGLKVIPPLKKLITMAQRIDKPYLTATLDGKIKAIDGNPWNFKGKGILELKTHIVKNKTDEENRNGRIPNEYLTQILHYLLVYNDFNFAVLVAKLLYQKELNGKRTIDHEEIRYYYINRKDFEKRIERLDKKESEFYEQYIKGNQIPRF